MSKVKLENEAEAWAFSTSKCTQSAITKIATCLKIKLLSYGQIINTTVTKL